MIVDPFDQNQALTPDGQIAHALKVCDVENPSAPTLKEIQAGKIIGYAIFKEES